MTEAEKDEVIAAFKRDEFSLRSDWQGFCAFRRALHCQATDGHISALGTPKSIPHRDDCPYALLAKLEAK